MNKIDYNRLFLREAEKNRGKKLLLHCCCAPCTLGAIEKATEFFDVTLFWFNPNIYPQDEHDHRFSELKRIAEIYSVPVIDGGYDHTLFDGIVCGREEEGEGKERCRDCLFLRIKATARLADQLNFDLFTTTLTVSPHKNSERINLLGEKAQEKAVWLHSDFKKKGGFDRSTELCEKYGVYRQNYCGCKP